MIGNKSFHFIFWRGGAFPKLVFTFKHYINPDWLIIVIIIITLYDRTSWKNLTSTPLAKTFFDLREYERAAFFVDDCQSNKAFFLHMYADYLVSPWPKVPVN